MNLCLYLRWPFLLSQLLDVRSQDYGAPDITEWCVIFGVFKIMPKAEPKSETKAEAKAEAKPESKTKYSDGEKVLCYHGKLIYEAKVSGSRATP